MAKLENKRKALSIVEKSLPTAKGRVKDDLLERQYLLRNEIDRLESGMNQTLLQQAGDAVAAVGKWQWNAEKKAYDFIKEAITGPPDKYNDPTNPYNNPTENGQGEVTSTSKPNIELTRSAIIDALQNATAEPSAEQVDQMRTYLNTNKVQTIEDLRKLPQKEAFNAAWIMAASQPGPASDKIAVAQQILNLVERGDTTMSSKDEAQIINAQQDNILAAARLRFDGQKEVFDRGEAGAKDFDKISELVSRVEAGVSNEKGKYVRPTQDATIALNEIARKVRSNTLQPEQQAAASELFMGALVPHMAATLAEVEDTSLFRPITNILDLFRDQARLGAGGNGLERMRIEYKNGKPASMYMTDGAGGRAADTTVSFDKLSRHYSSDMVRAIVAAVEGFQGSPNGSKK